METSWPVACSLPASATVVVQNLVSFCRWPAHLKLALLKVSSHGRPHCVQVKHPQFGRTRDRFTSNNCILWELKPGLLVF